ncbi:hypothetical protein LCI18_013968 [Fusarium solani-melongenae]|uniref:Uncharacterized protein n=1 Tax=Fusarium solani subsp. cucurbitae TaxID=2747967 RepID=A0ACD3ZPM5_FUSSC|nr:hypothetical protein LCI18_013968 [Fusarium solani-melongenae]
MTAPKKRNYGALSFLKQLNQLHRKVSLARSSACFTTLQHISADIADLRTQIHLWQPSPPTSSTTPASDGAHVNETWQQGLLCYLYADVCALPSSDERIQECVARGIMALRELSWMHSIIFPTFMMDIHALTAEHRAVLGSSYRAMANSLSFSTRLSTVQLLRKIWAELDANEPSMFNWRRLMRDSDI